RLPLYIAVDMLMWMSLIWNLFNLLPIWPLDGGQISREVFGAFSPGNDFRYCLILSLLLAGLGALYSLAKATFRPELPYPPFRPVMPAIFLALMAVECFQLLQRIEQERRRWQRDNYDDY